MPSLVSGRGRTTLSSSHTVVDPVCLVSGDFLVLLAIAFFLAVPVGWYYLHTWLSRFAFQAYIGPGLFLLAGAVNFLLALITLSYHSVRIAKTNPVETLRYE